MDFEIPSDIQQTLSQLDQFIDDVIKPIEQRDDNIRFVDHRREYARTDFETVEYLDKIGKLYWRRCAAQPMLLG